MTAMNFDLLVPILIAFVVFLLGVFVGLWLSRDVPK